MEHNITDLLKRTCELTCEYLDGVGARPVAGRVDFQTLLAQMRDARRGIKLVDD